MGSPLSAVPSQPQLQTPAMTAHIIQQNLAHQQKIKIMLDLENCVSRILLNYIRSKDRKRSEHQWQCSSGDAWCQLFAV
jgi:hypothetical protein